LTKTVHNVSRVEAPETGDSRPGRRRSRELALGRRRARSPGPFPRPPTYRFPAATRANVFSLASMAAPPARGTGPALLRNGCEVPKAMRARPFRYRGARPAPRRRGRTGLSRRPPVATLPLLGPGGRAMFSPQLTGFICLAATILPPCGHGSSSPRFRVTLFGMGQSHLMALKGFADQRPIIV
jgi:hypothetical protein